MCKWLKLFLLGCSFFIFSGFTQSHVLNLYSWADYFPDDVLAQFEKETGIHVRYSTFDNAAQLYAKLKATNNNSGYDVIIPGSDYIKRMINENMLEKLDKSKLPELKNMDPTFLNEPYDPTNDYSLPYLWGSTCILVNRKYHPDDIIRTWNDLWKKEYRDQLLLLNGMRETFSVGLIQAKQSPNASDPDAIKKGYEALTKLIPNVKLFNDDAVKTIYLGEDATIGMAWSTDAYLAQKEDPHLEYIYPEDGYILWMDTMAIAKNAPHKAESLQFINFIMRPDVAEKIAEETATSTPNREAMKLLPTAMKNNRTLYPSQKDLARGIMLSDIGNANNVYTHYWEMLKLSV